MLMKPKEIIALFGPSSELWHGDLAQYGWFKRKFLFLARVVRLVLRGFMGDQCNLHASALTYCTLMSLVPLLALGLALARVFGGGDLVREKISAEINAIGKQLVSGSVTEASAELTQQFIAQLHQYANQILDQIGDISFGTLGGVGLVVLLWMAITMLSQVERSFNSVWDAPQRTLWRKCADYVAIIIVVPFLALAASTIPIVALVTKYACGYTFGLLSEEWFARLLRFAISSALMVSLFVVVLIFVPNTRIRFKAGLIGGMTTAILFAVWLKICMALQIGVVKYSRLYGGLAALPILLAWVYMSWQIILFGAELTFAVQHSASFFRDEGAQRAGARPKWRLAAALCVEMARRWARGEGPFDSNAYVASRHISGRLVSDVLGLLAAAGIVAETGDKSGVFVLLRAPDKITVSEIVDAIADAGTPPEALGLSPSEDPLRNYFARSGRQVADQLSVPISALAESETREMVDGKVPALRFPLANA